MPSPMRTRASPGAVIHTPGSNSVPAPTSRRPSRSASSTLPCTGQRTNASRRAISQWIARAVPRQRVALVPAPLLQPELGLGGGHRGRESQVHRGLQVHGTPRGAGRGRAWAVVGNAPCFVPCWPRWPRAPWCPRRPWRPLHTVAPGETLWGIAYANNLADERGGRRQRPLARGARGRRHEPHHPRARAGADPAGQPGAVLPRHDHRAGGLGRRWLPRRSPATR